MSRHSARGRRWQQLLADMRRSYAVLLCCRCGKMINPDLVWPHKLSLSGDHYPIPADQLTKDERLDPRFVRPAHLDCNRSAGNRPPSPRLNTSRSW